MDEKIGIFTLSKLVGLVTGARVTDPTSGYHVCNNKTIHLFAKHYPTDYPEVESFIKMEQYTILWLILSGMMIIFSLFPIMLDKLVIWLKVSYAPSMLYFLGFIGT